MRKTRWAVALIACGLVPAAWASEDVMLVLDASGSMWGQIGGQPKIVIAREAVAGLLAEWTPEDRLGLIAYGHRRRGDCADIEQVLPLATVDAAAFRQRVDALQPKGMTPLSAAVQQAAQALHSSERKATVVLVSDGEETCDLDPCVVGAELEKSGVDFTAHVIGSDVSNPQHQEQLKCLARNTGGRYFNASDAAGLEIALSEATQAAHEKKLPPAEARLDAVDTATVASTIEVRWQGPATPGDYITVVEASAGPLAYRGYDDNLQSGQPARFVLPATAGDFELRYVSPKRDQPVLAKRPIKLGPAAATLEIAAQVQASDLVPFSATGPTGDGDWIGFAPAGGAAGEYRDYVRPDASGTTTGELAAPQQPGNYEFRYVLRESEAVIARREVVVLAARPSIMQPPTEVQVDQPLTLQFEGPRAPRNWIGFVPRGAGADRYTTYAYANAERQVEFMAPPEPGDYDLVFVVSGELGEQVAVRYPVTVAP